MYYIQTADRLTRTSVWLKKMEGGIEALKEVIIDDRLGIADELERQLQSLVDTYECEWKAVVNDPEKRRFFRQFANIDLAEPGVEFVTSAASSVRPTGRRTSSPSTILRGRAPVPDVASEYRSSPLGAGRTCQRLSLGGRPAVKYGRSQIAVFRFASRDRWYACENLCPHKREMVWRGASSATSRGPRRSPVRSTRRRSCSSGGHVSAGRITRSVFPSRSRGTRYSSHSRPKRATKDRSRSRTTPARPSVPFPAVSVRPMTSR